MDQNTNDQVLEAEDIQQLQEIIGDTETLPPIEIDLECYDGEEFERGITESSYLSGYITGLLNAGVSESFVLDYLLNKMTIEHNLEMAKMNNAAQIDITKNQKILIEKQEL